MINDKVQPWQLLNLLALRVVDADTKTEERLWYWEEGAAVTALYAIQDFAMYISLTASRYGLRLADIYPSAVAKRRTPDASADETRPTDRASELGQALTCLDLIGVTLDPRLAA